MKLHLTSNKDDSFRNVVVQIAEDIYKEIENSKEPIKKLYGIQRIDKEGNRLDYIKEEVKSTVKFV